MDTGTTEASIQAEYRPFARACAEADPPKLYLSAASRSALPSSVAEAAAAALAAKFAPWSLDGDPTPDALRSAYGELVGCPSDHVAITPSTSYTMSMIAKALVAHGTVGRVVLLANQNSSAVLPWQTAAAAPSANLELVFVGEPDETAQAPTTESITQAVLDLLADPDMPVAVVALPPLAWTDGLMVDLAAVGAAAAGTSPDTLMVVDGSQALGVLPLTLSDLHADFICGSVHKWMLGLYGTCLSGFSPRLLRLVGPLESHERARSTPPVHGVIPYVPGLGYPTPVHDDARKLDGGGRPNPVLLPAVLQGLSLIKSWGGPQAIADRLAPLTAAIVAAARALGMTAPETHAPHLVGIRPPSASCAVDAYTALSDAGVVLSLRDGALRIAPYVYTTPDDVARFIDLLGAWHVQHALTCDLCTSGSTPGC